MKPAPAASDGLRDAVNALLHQIEIGDFVDSNGHSAKMLKPVHDLMRLLSEPAAPAVPAVQIGMKASTWETLSSDAQTLILEAGQRAVDKTKARRVTDAAARAMTPIPLGGSAAPAVPDDVLRALLKHNEELFAAYRARTAVPAVPAVREPLTDEQVSYLEQQAFASTNHTIERPIYQHWFRKGVRAGYGITGDSNG